MKWNESESKTKWYMQRILWGNSGQKGEAYGNHKVNIGALLYADSMSLSSFMYLVSVYLVANVASVMKAATF